MGKGGEILTPDLSYYGEGGAGGGGWGGGGGGAGFLLGPFTETGGCPILTK